MRGWMAHRKYLIFVHACAGTAMIFTPARVPATLAPTPPRSDFCLTVPRKEEESDDSYLQIRHKTGERERDEGKRESEIAFQRHRRRGEPISTAARAHPSGFIVGGSGTSHNKRTRRLV